VDRPSLAGALPTQGPRWSRLPARLGLVLIVLWVVAMVYRSSPSPEIRDLEGSWTLQALDDDGRLTQLDRQLPGVWSTALGGPDRVFATTEVLGTGAPMALWVERPRYAIEVTWDGVPLAQSGNPRGVERSARPIFVVLPEEERGTRHELGLEIAGAYGEAGVLGQVVVGPIAAVHDLTSSARVSPIATSLALAFLAALPLAVAARASWRPAYSLYGLAVTLSAVVVWAHSTHPALSGVPVGWQLALQRTALFLAMGTLGAFVTTFVEGRVSRTARRLLSISCILALGSALVTGDLAWWARLGAHGFAGFVSLLAMGLVRTAVRRRSVGHPLLVVALVVGLLALGLELLSAYGVRPLPLGSYLWVLGMMVVLGAALVLQDADRSERHQRLLERFPDPLITVDANGFVVDANPSARVALGIDARTTDAPRVFGWIASEHHPRIRGHLRRGLHRTDHIELLTTQGRWYESAATPVAEDRVLLDLRDITARRDMDRGLLQAARAETAGLLLGGLAHDFNNMLGTLLAHVGILKLRVRDADLSERLHRMEGSIERAASLTKRVLTVARGTNTTLTACDLRATCLGAAELVEPTYGPGLHLTLDLPSDLPPVHGDAEDLEQVLVNLLVNARDAVGATGNIRLAARAFELPGGQQGVVAMVEDDGPGVPDDLREDLFEPFVTTKGHGTGLGLAVARQILADHHGRLWHEVAPGGGARFLMALRHADVVSSAPAPLPEKRRLLVVDDEEVLLEAWTNALQEAGYEVVATTDPVRAIETIRQQPPDLLVTDLAMAPLSGLEVARALQSRAPQVPVLVVSAFVAPDVQAQLSARGWEYLTKPIRSARLVAAVGHLRRQAERRQAGEDDITSVMHVFPALEQLSAESLGFPPRPTSTAAGTHLQ